MTISAVPFAIVKRESRVIRQGPPCNFPPGVSKQNQWGSWWEVTNPAGLVAMGAAAAQSELSYRLLSAENQASCTSSSIALQESPILAWQVTALRRARLGVPHQQWEEEDGKGHRGKQKWQSTGQTGQN